ncbi:DEKNAAC105573 [Brettanomyces naardenensis]|uniref:DEKNAAC105573 n=1 Tax=Brettanomyces naardenensis TaxID=13370 RepID=A0A448YTU6_BRENA|nr:DEKNAAC105573 [Brettanomyces naardenensis]
MPVNYIATLITKGPENTPGWSYIKRYGPPLLITTLLKMYFNGSSNTWERDLHGKVFIVTGGTSGIGAALVKEMSTRGAQIVLLTSQLSADNSGAAWVTDYVQDVRDSTRNPLVFVEDCDLSSLYSVRKFATKWLDNRTARRLDGVVCLASERVPSGKSREVSVDGIERQMAVNYLGHFHLLTLLQPALKAQPPDRDVRIILTTCLSQSMGTVDLDDLLWQERRYPSNRPWKVYGTSKLMLHMFAKELQRRLVKAGRKDLEACNVRVNVVNPGLTRTPSTRRAISMGSVLGLLIYLVLYPIFWLFLKSGESGMQSFLYSLCCPDLMDSQGGKYIKECSVVGAKLRKELQDEELQKKVFDKTADQVAELERSSALERNRKKGKKGKKETKLEKKVQKKGKEKGEKSLEDVKRGLFRSAFSEPEDVYPELRKRPLPKAQEEARTRQLNRLEQKYLDSRRKQKDESLELKPDTKASTEE